MVWSTQIAESAVAGTRSANLYHAVDWLPTLVAVAGGNTQRNLKPLDGFDILPSLLHPSTVPAPRAELLINANPLPCGGIPTEGDSDKQAQIQQGAAIIMDTVDGRLKLVLPNGWPPAAVPEEQRFLHNLTADPRELVNLYRRVSQQQPALLATMMQRLDALISEAVTPMTWFAPFQGDSYFCAECPVGNTTGPLQAWVPWGAY